MVALICGRAGKVMEDFPDIHGGDLLSVWVSGSWGADSMGEALASEGNCKNGHRSSPSQYVHPMQCDTGASPVQKQGLFLHPLNLGLTVIWLWPQRYHLCIVTCPLATLGNIHSLPCAWAPNSLLEVETRGSVIFFVPGDMQPITRHASEAIHGSLTAATWMSPEEAKKNQPVDPSQSADPQHFELYAWLPFEASEFGVICYTKKWQIGNWGWLLGKFYFSWLEKRRYFLSSCCTSSLGQALLYIWSTLGLTLGIWFPLVDRIILMLQSRRLEIQNIWG